MNSERWIESELADLRRLHQLRTLSTLPQAGGHVTLDGRTYINFSSNDYLDFLGRPELAEAAAEATRRDGAGSGASRLVTGTLPVHTELEQEIARHKGYPAALLFGSGYLANLGVITALAGRDDHVFADRLIHASLIDAIRLSGATLHRFAHNDLDDVANRLRAAPATGRRLIVSESVFSMDGDLAPLDGLAALAEEHDAMLMIDEAHATGVFGPAGRGLIADAALQSRVNISMCTLSKALGGYGGAVACSPLMRDWLVNKARSFIYTTALPPGVCAAARAALLVLDREPGLGVELLRRAALFRAMLHERGFDTGKSNSQIVPVFIGDNEQALQLAARLRERGIIVTAMRPPTVPPGTARLRFSLTSAHTEAELAITADQLAACAETAGYPT